MPTIAIVGVGAIGAVLAGLLQHHDLTLCTRRPLPTLHIDTPEGPITVQARNLTEPAVTQPYDWILCATKTYDAPTAALWFPSLTGPQTRLAVIQNGVEHRETFAGLFPPARILPVVIDVPCERRPDGSVLQRAPALLRIENSPIGQDFAALFANTHATLDLTDDFLSAAWNKLCLNAAGVLSAILLKPNIIYHDEAIGELTLALIEECATVARAEGAIIPPDIATRILAGNRNGSPDSVNSMLADLLAHRPTEIEARNGVILRRAALHKTPVPLNRMAVALIQSMTHNSSTW